MIFIDIEMPNRCADCPCFKITRSDGEIYGHDSCQLLHLIFNEDVYYGKHIHNPFESRYKDCPLKNSSDFLKKITNRPSEDLISRADAIRVVEKNSYRMAGLTEVKLKCEIEALPSTDRPRGEWIESREQNILMAKRIEKGETWRVCSNCGTGFMIGAKYEGQKSYGERFHNFCPRCGAAMRGNETDESNN